LELKVQKLRREISGRESERLIPEHETRRVFFEQSSQRIPRAWQRHFKDRSSSLQELNLPNFNKPVL
jgi:hypothetical protein